MERNFVYRKILLWIILSLTVHVDASENNQYFTSNTPNLQKITVLPKSSDHGGKAGQFLYLQPKSINFHELSNRYPYLINTNPVVVEASRVQLTNTVHHRRTPQLLLLSDNYIVPLDRGAYQPQRTIFLDNIGQEYFGLTEFDPASMTSNPLAQLQQKQANIVTDFQTYQSMTSHPEITQPVVNIIPSEVQIRQLSNADDLVISSNSPEDDDGVNIRVDKVSLDNPELVMLDIDEQDDRLERLKELLKGVENEEELLRLSNKLFRDVYLIEEFVKAVSEKK